MDAFLNGLKRHNSKDLATIFHPRLGVDANHISAIQSRLEEMSGKNPEISLYKLWKITSDSQEGVSCNDEGLTIYPQTGYAEQYAVMISILGEKDIVRIFSHLVPYEDKWQIASFHGQKWTHQEKDASTWNKQSQEFLAAGDKFSAYIAASLAKNLIFGSGYYVYQDEKSFAEGRDKIFTESQFTEQIQSLIPQHKILKASPLFAQTGAGLLIRYLLPEELSAVALRELCQKQVTAFSQTPWFAKTLKGLRCSFNLPGEDTEKEGRLGSQWMDG